MFLQEFNPFLIEERSVGQDHDFASQAVKIKVKLFKSGISQAFAPGKGGPDHSCFPGLVHQVFPLFGLQDSTRAKLAAGEMNITHSAAEVAKRCQFKLAPDRNAFYSGLLLDEI